MEKILERIDTLIEANKADEARTPYLDVALGALKTARLHYEHHGRELQVLAKNKADTEARELDRLEKLKAAKGPSRTGQEATATTTAAPAPAATK